MLSSIKRFPSKSKRVRLLSLDAILNGLALPMILFPRIIRSVPLLPLASIVLMIKALWYLLLLPPPKRYITKTESLFFRTILDIRFWNWHPTAHSLLHLLVPLSLSDLPNLLKDLPGLMNPFLQLLLPSLELSQHPSRELISSNPLPPNSQQQFSISMMTTSNLRAATSKDFPMLLTLTESSVFFKEAHPPSDTARSTTTAPTFKSWAKQPDSKNLNLAMISTTRTDLWQNWRKKLETKLWSIMLSMEVINLSLKELMYVFHRPLSLSTQDAIQFPSHIRHITVLLLLGMSSLLSCSVIRMLIAYISMLLLEQ